MKRWSKIIAGAIVVGLVAGLFLQMYIGHRSREANAAAEAYADRMQMVISADPRFQNVVVYRFSGFGCARYRGNVVTADDRAALQRIIDESSPPSNITVQANVIVGPPNPAATEGLR